MLLTLNKARPTLLTSPLYALGLCRKSMQILTWPLFEPVLPEVAFLGLTPAAPPRPGSQRPAFQFCIFDTSDSHNPGLLPLLNGAHLVLINYSVHFLSMVIVLKANKCDTHPASQSNLWPLGNLFPLIPCTHTLLFSWLFSGSLPHERVA